MMKKRQSKPHCEHLGFNNKRDCENEAEYACRCCNAPVCSEHLEKLCPYGGMTYQEIED